MSCTPDPLQYPDPLTSLTSPYVFIHAGPTICPVEHTASTTCIVSASFDPDRPPTHMAHSIQTVSFEFHSPPSLITPLRVLFAWSIIRLRHPLLGARVEFALPHPSSDSNDGSKPTLADYEAYYRSASFVIDTPFNPESVLRATEESGTLDVSDLEPVSSGGRTKRRLQDLVWDYSNGPRWLSPDRLAGMKISRAESSSSSSASISAQPHSSSDSPEGRDTFIMFFSAIHCIMDGIGTFVLGNEMFELLAGSGRGSRSPSGSSIPRTDAELRALLDLEWSKRYGKGGALSAIVKSKSGAVSQSSEPESGLLTLPFESRVPAIRSPEEAKAAREDYEADQRRFVVSRFPGVLDGFSRSFTWHGS